MPNDNTPDFVPLAPVKRPVPYTPANLPDVAAKALAAQLRAGSADEVRAWAAIAQAAQALQQARHIIQPRLGIYTSDLTDIANTLHDMSSDLAASFRHESA